MSGIRGNRLTFVVMLLGCCAIALSYATASGFAGHRVRAAASVPSGHRIAVAASNGSPLQHWNEIDWP
jgi:hypothetical protein